MDFCDFFFLVFNTADRPTTRKRSCTSPVEDEEHAAKRRASKVALLRIAILTHHAFHPFRVETLQHIPRMLR